MKKLFTALCAILLGLTTHGQNQKPFVIPELQEWKGNNGIFTPQESFTIFYEDETLLPIAELLSDDWKTMFGTTLSVAYGKGQKGSINLCLKKDKDLGEEGYSIKVSEGIYVYAPKTTGAYWATRTILQIAEQSQDHSFPKGTLRDWPDYPVRGFMLDAGRKYIPLEYMNDLVKIMSYYKMNTLQVHLNDNGFKQFFYHDWDKTYAAFRLESKTYPGLAARDGYYTKNEFGQFQDEAAEYFVDIIPEIDIPAHTLAFAHYKPELGSKEYGMDHLDLDYPGMYDFFDALFKEYLEGDKPVFRGKKVHIGTDEYSNKDQSTVEKFRALTDHYIRYVESFGKTACLWGSLTYAKGSTPIKSENVVMLTWSKDFTNTQDMFDLGYKTISIPDKYVYIVPATGYYQDYLNICKLYNEWTPAHTVDKVYEEGHPNILGGMFAVWNDNCGNGVSVKDIHHRIFPAMQTLSSTMWNVVRDLPFESFNKERELLSEAPGVNQLARIKGQDGIIFECSELCPGTEVPYKEIGYDYSISFTMGATEERLGTELFNSGNAIFYLSDPISGLFGFARDGYLYTFNFKPYYGEKVDICVQGDNKSTSLYVNGKLYESLDIQKRIYESSNRPTYQVRTLVFPLGKAREFNSKITNFKVSNKK